MSKELVNKENIKKMIAYIKTVNEDKFDMKRFSSVVIKRDIELLKNPLHTCNSAGCVIGHCVHLDEDNLERFFNDTDTFSYYAWSLNYVFNFIEHSIPRDIQIMWEFLFGTGWDNNLGEAILRMEYVIKHNCAPDWFDINLSSSYKISMVGKDK